MMRRDKLPGATSSHSHFAAGWETANTARTSLLK